MKSQYPWQQIVVKCTTCTRVMWKHEPPVHLVSGNLTFETGSIWICRYGENKFHTYYSSKEIIFFFQRVFKHFFNSYYLIQRLEKINVFLFHDAI